MRKQIIMGLGLTLVLAGTSAAQGQADRRQERPRGTQQRGPEMRGPRGMPDGLLLRDITLTGEQRSQIAQLRKSERESLEARRDQGEAQRREVRAARARGDTAAVRAILTRNRQAMEQEQQRRFDAIRGILTAEQRVQFDKNVAELKARDAERAQRMGDRGPREERGQPRGGKVAPRGGSFGSRG